MKKIFAIVLLFLITKSLFSQEMSFFYEKIFIRKLTKEYVNYEKKYKPKILKIVLDSLKEEALNKDSLEIIVVPTVNYKKFTSYKYFKPDTTKFFYYLNTRKLYFGEAFVFYKDTYIGYIIITKSFKNPNLIYVYNTASSFYKNFLLDKKECVKFQVHNKCNLFFFIENNKVGYVEKSWYGKVYDNIDELKITPDNGIWYNKIEYVEAK